MRAAQTLNFVAAALLGLAVAPGAHAQASNLPDVPQGVFNASARIAIDAPIENVWHALLDFPTYPDWNPFVRYAFRSPSLSRPRSSDTRASTAVATDAFFAPLPADEQTAVENKRLIFHVQIPPLPQPVDASTPPNALHSQSSIENVTHVQHGLYRVAWKQIMFPDVVLESERWSALSVLEGGGTLYESREVYLGTLATTLQTLYGVGLQEAFEAQAQALKILMEQGQ